MLHSFQRNDMNVWNRIKSIYDNIKKRWVSYTAVAVIGMGANGCGSDSAPKVKEIKTDKIENIVRVKNPVKPIKYTTDTISGRGGTLLYYLNGTITRNYVEKDNMYKMSLPLFSHEDWHAHVDKIKWRYCKYTPFEYYKLCMHNEISANIAALLTARYQYMRAKDKKSFIKKHKGKIFGFYFNEVEKGKIKPGSCDKKEQEKEYSLIANGVQKVWMERCAKGYMPITFQMLRHYVALHGLISDSRINYNYVKRYMYTIGGVDFSKYTHNDIVPDDNRVFVSDGLRKVSSLRKGGVVIMDYVNDKYPLVQQIGIDKRCEAFQHLLIAAQLKYLLKDKSKEELQANPQIADICYSQVLYKFNNDKTFTKYINEFSVMTDNYCFVKSVDEKEYSNIISQIYSFNGIDFSKSIKYFNKKAVPVKNSVYGNYLFYVSPPYEMQSEITAKRTPKTSSYIIAEEYKNNYTPKQYKGRRSEVQVIEAPNYAEPILTSATMEDMSKIFAIIDKFDNIPQVLKECDTEAQRRYYASLEKNTKNKSAQTEQKNDTSVVTPVKSGQCR